MVQKQRERQSGSKVEKFADGVSETIGSSKSKNGTLSRLYSSVMKEGDAKEGAIAGVLTSFVGLVTAGLIPFTILPMLMGFTLGGAVLGKVMPDKVHSVIGGVAVSSFLTFFLFVNIPILGLGLISTLLFTLVTTGATVGAYEYSN